MSKFTLQMTRLITLHLINVFNFSKQREQIVAYSEPCQISKVKCLTKKLTANDLDYIISRFLLLYCN